MPEAVPMEQIGEEWIEFMTTFTGRESAQRWRDVFYTSLEKYALEQYDFGYGDAEYDHDKTQEV